MLYIWKCLNLTFTLCYVASLFIFNFKYVIVLERKKYIKSISFVQDISNQRYERLCGLPKRGDIDAAEFYLVQICIYAFPILLEII